MGRVGAQSKQQTALKRTTGDAIPSHIDRDLSGWDLHSLSIRACRGAFWNECGLPAARDDRLGKLPSRFPVIAHSSHCGDPAICPNELRNRNPLSSATGMERSWFLTVKNGPGVPISIAQM
jgi:hypothetical protein